MSWQVHDSGIRTFRNSVESSGGLNGPLGLQRPPCPLTPDEVLPGRKQGPVQIAFGRLSEIRHTFHCGRA
jgi:hypothetical protein